jgi:hypothetical protein
VSGPADLPAEAIDAGARAIFRATGDAGYDGGAWADAQRDAHDVLAAALPRIHAHEQAQAWQEGLNAGYHMAKCWGYVDYWEDWPPNPYLSARGGDQHD